LYSKARKGEVKEFTGISSPYEEPLHPEIKVNTNEMSVNQAIDAILQRIEDHKEV
jgi:adenylylsulfate kinase